MVSRQQLLRCVWVQRFCPKYGCEVPARAMDVLIKRLPFYIFLMFECRLLSLFAGTALLCGAVQLLACGFRVFFKKSPTRLDRAKQKNKIKNDQ